MRSVGWRLLRSGRRKEEDEVREVSRGSLGRVCWLW